MLPDGQAVVVKVQHSGIERVRNDLEILIQLAELAENYSKDIARYRLERQGIRRTLRDELDFTREQNNLSRFSRNFRKTPLSPSQHLSAMLQPSHSDHGLPCRNRTDRPQSVGRF